LYVSLFADSYDGPLISSTPGRRKFADQLKDFDSAWLHYLDQFVAWKVKDLNSLEGDLIKVALQLESSMHQVCPPFLAPLSNGLGEALLFEWCLYDGTTWRLGSEGPMATS
jgi:hypothetical protein